VHARIENNLTSANRSWASSPDGTLFRTAGRVRPFSLWFEPTAREDAAAALGLGTGFCYGPPMPAHPPSAPDSGAEHESDRRPAVFLALLVLTGVVLIAALNAMPLTDPDEVFYAQTAREMLAKHSFLTPLLFGQPQFEKPPLTYWLLMASFKAFGMTPWAARLVPALFGLLGALATYLFAKRVLPRGTAALAALILATGMLYLGQSIALLTDMVFSVLVAGSLYCFYAWFQERRERFLYLFAVLLALAVLAKGPVSLIIVLLGVVVFLRLTGDGAALRSFLLHPWWLAFLALALPWYLAATFVHGRAFTWEFLVHDNWHRILRAEHTNFDTWYFYPALVVVGIFPWSAFLAFLGAGFRKYRTYVLFLLSWFLGTYVPFGIAHSKLPSYILPLFPAVAIALAISLESVHDLRRRSAVAAGITFLLGLGLGAVPFLARGPLAAEIRPLLTAFGVFGLVQLAVGGLLLLRRLVPAIALNAVGFLAVVLVGSLTIPASATAGFTDAGLPTIVAEHGLAGRTILASKFYVRGVWSATSSPVVVMDTRENPFWSQHPVRVLTQDDEIRAFFDGKEKVLCVIRPGDLDRLNGLFGGTRSNTVLSNAFDRVVVLSVKK
jgi:4-amino-4-deoxy-L-arabinose transferase-like glycosyltransferase